MKFTRFAVFGLAISLLAGVAGCSEASAPTAAKSAAPSADPKALPTDIENDPVARKSVRLDRCEGTADGWTAAGKIHNTGDQAKEFSITVFFTNTSGTTQAMGKTSVEVGAGAAEEWSAPSTFDAPETTLCVIRGVSAVAR